MDPMGKHFHLFLCSFLCKTSTTGRPQPGPQAEHMTKARVALSPAADESGLGITVCPMKLASLVNLRYPLVI